jgi:hypothetical protein
MPVPVFFAGADMIRTGENSSLILGRSLTI